MEPAELNKITVKTSIHKKVVMIELTSLHKIHIGSFHHLFHLVHLDMADGKYNKHPKNFDCMCFCRCLPFCWHLICIEWLKFCTCHNHNGSFALCIIQSNRDHHDTCNYKPNIRQPAFPPFLSILERMSNMHKVLAA